MSIPLDTKIPEDLPQSTLDIAAIGAAPFDLWVKRYPMEVFAVLLRDIEKALEPKKHINPAVKLLKEYHKFLDVFSRQEADMLPVHQSYDHKIPLEDGKQPTFGALYGMSQDELKVLQKYLDDHLSKGFIWANSSPAAAPVLFVHKPGGGLRFCIDYQRVNAITVKNRYPLPLIKETLDCLCNAVIYTKLDIHRASPFKVKRVINPYAYELDLPRAYGVHPVFHVNLLDPVATDSLKGHQQQPPPPILIDGEEE